MLPLESTMRRLQSLSVVVLLVAGGCVIERAAAEGRTVAVTPILHGSVQLESGAIVVQVDPWSAADLSHAKPADLILVTSAQAHHLDVEAIRRLRKPGAPVIIPAPGRALVTDGTVLANGESRQFGAFRVEAVAAYDLTPGEPQHPKGQSNGYVLTIGGARVLVSGVTECVPEIRALKSLDIAILPMNIPVNRMTPTAVGACVAQLKPRVVYVYHYDPEYTARVTASRSRTERISASPAITESLRALRAAVTDPAIDVRLPDWYPPRGE
jgi:L-ascorbate metabolism protein UlaG (beta-lactamase superfamily)